MTYRGTVGLGLTTWKRPDRFRQARASIVRHLSRYLDFVVVCQDGGDNYISDSPSYWRTIDHRENLGWARAKNDTIQRLVQLGCDHVFMMEDDVVVTDPRAVAGYVDAALASGHHYMTAHPWGETTTRKVETDGPITYWAYCGSWWTYMSRYGIETGGTYNPTLGGIMGDIELPQRWQLRGLTSGWGRLPDATGSEAWVEPHCLTVDQSTIATQPGWSERQEYLLRWWCETMPETVPTELKPAREGRWAMKCEDVKLKVSSSAIDAKFI